MRINKEYGLIFLSGDIEDHDKVDELCEFIMTKKVDEEYKLMLNSSGGSVPLGIQLINTIRNCCNPIIHCVISGRAFSMAAEVALACDSLDVLPGSVLMFHGSLVILKEDECDTLYAHQQYMSCLQKNQDYLSSLMQPFLTIEEIRRINLGDELYIHWDDPTLPDRIKRHFESEAIHA